MSADNGIYILKMKGQSRVIHAQAIDNLWWSHLKGESQGEMVSTRIVEYYKDAKPMTYEDALKTACIMEKNCYILEYGINTFAINKTWNQIVNEAKEYAKLELEALENKDSRWDWERRRLEEVLKLELTQDETRICIDCGNEFILKGGEIDFYNINNLHLPKRCKDCRKKNKENKQKEAS